jgi:hypothetical protein
MLLCSIVEVKTIWYFECDNIITLLLKLYVIFLENSTFGLPSFLLSVHASLSTSNLFAKTVFGNFVFLFFLFQMGRLVFLLKRF